MTPHSLLFSNIGPPLWVAPSLISPTSASSLLIHTSAASPVVSNSLILSAGVRRKSISSGSERMHSNSPSSSGVFGISRAPGGRGGYLGRRRPFTRGLSGRSLRRALRVQVVAGDARASSPRAPCRLARVSMKPRCRLHEPIRFINCSTSSFYSSIFIPNPGHLLPGQREKCFAQGWDEPLITRKSKAKRFEAHCFVSQ